MGARMKELGFRDEDTYEFDYIRNPRENPIYRFYETVRKTPSFKMKIDRLPSYNEDYRPVRMRIANADEMLTQLVAIDDARPELCGKISPNSVLLLRPPVIMALRDNCFFSIAQNTHKSSLCRKMRPQGDSGGRYPSQEQCKAQAKYASSRFYYGPQIFSTMESFVQVMQRLGYEKPFLPAGPPDWTEIYFYWASGSLEKKREFLKRVETLPTFKN